MSDQEKIKQILAIIPTATEKQVKNLLSRNQNDVGKALNEYYSGGSAFPPDENFRPSAELSQSQDFSFGFGDANAFSTKGSDNPFETTDVFSGASFGFGDSGATSNSSKTSPKSRRKSVEKKTDTKPIDKKEEKKRKELEKKKEIEQKKKEAEEKRKKELEEKERKIKEAKEEKNRKLKEARDKKEQAHKKPKNKVELPSENGSDEEELSPTSDNAIQWTTAMRKQKRSILFTIQNTSSHDLVRKKMHQAEGSWRRQPPKDLEGKGNCQFGVEGKASIKGSVEYIVANNPSETIKISWESGKTNRVDALIPPSATQIEVKTNIKGAVNEKGDVVLVISDKGEAALPVDPQRMSLPLQKSTASPKNESSQRGSLPAAKESQKTESDDFFSSHVKKQKEKDDDWTDSDSDSEDDRMKKFKGIKIEQTSFWDLPQEGTPFDKLQLEQGQGSSGSISRGRRKHDTVVDSTFSPFGAFLAQPEPQVLDPAQAKEKAAPLMIKCFEELEEGSLLNALRLAKDALEIVKGNQSLTTTVATYTVAISRLTLRPSSKSNTQQAALSLFVALLPLHPRHRVIALRKAIADLTNASDFKSARTLLSVLQDVAGQETTNDEKYKELASDKNNTNSGEEVASLKREWVVDALDLGGEYTWKSELLDKYFESWKNFVKKAQI